MTTTNSFPVLKGCYDTNEYKTLWSMYEIKDTHLIPYQDHVSKFERDSKGKQSYTKTIIETRRSILGSDGMMKSERSLAL